MAAARRLVPQIRLNLPDKKIILGGDALFANGPYIRFLQEQDMRFIFSIKPGSHASLFEQAEQLEQAGNMKIITKTSKSKQLKYITKYANNLMLNQQNQDILVNFIRFEEHNLKTGKVKIFTFITDIIITQSNYDKIVKAGRARWKIENETFNTLKNQRYQFEHNFGHGKEYLSANFAQLMLLAFLFDQIQSASNQVFRIAAYHANTKKELWERVRQLIELVIVDNMQTIYKIIAKKVKLKVQIST